MALRPSMPLVAFLLAGLLPMFKRPSSCTGKMFQNMSGDELASQVVRDLVLLLSAFVVV
jgi:hypothetical protein